jgi:pimeloyl-ACP methyl ester carboxylesterase
MKAVAKVHYPLIPAFLLRDPYPAREAIQGLHLPLALILAEQDEVIPMALGGRLAEGYTGPAKTWVEAGAGHNTLRLGGREGVLREALTFIEENGKR